MPLLDGLKSLFSEKRVNISKRFELLSSAVVGRMSKFYKARDLHDGSVVGLKILDPKKLAAFEDRFKGLAKPGEGEIALQLKHPRIVRTLQSGLSAEGEHYLVMEFLEGPRVDSLVRSPQEQLESRRMRFIRQAAEALIAVHHAGFIHRDVCPRNLMLTGDGENVKLIDFGLTVPATKPFMQPGNRTGTLNYMPPELVRRHWTDHRLDVFAFGVTAYEICTHDLPWIASTTGTGVTHDQPPKDIRTLRPEINGRLADAIHACIEPDVNRRFGSIEEFVRMVRKVDRVDG